MCAEWSQCMDHTGLAPAHSGTCFPGLHCSGSMALCRGTIQSVPCILCTFQIWAAQVQFLRYSTRAQTQLGERFVPFPGPSSAGDYVLGEHTVPGGPCILIISPVLAAQFPGVPWEHHLMCGVCLLWGADLRLQLSWQMSTVQDPRKTRLATGSLLTVWWRMLSLGPRLPLAFWLPLCLLLGVGGPFCSQLALLWYSLIPLFCKPARLCLRLELFMGKFSLLLFFFFFSLWLSHSLGYCLTLAPSDCPWGIQAWSLPKHATWASLSSPCLLVAVREHLGYFSAGSWGQVHILWVFFSSWLYCPLRFQNSPPTCQWKVSCFLETSPSWLPPQDGSPSLTLLSLLFFFCHLYFVLPPFEENSLPFWVPSVLRQHSEVVLWKLLSIQMIFWWICGEESGLTILFLCHLRTTPCPFLFIFLSSSKCVVICVTARSILI